MKRFGRIMFCFLPALLAFGLQQLISIPAVGLALLSGFYTKGATSIDDCMNAFLNIISTANFNAGVSAAYGTVALVVFAYCSNKNAEDNRNIKWFPYIFRFCLPELFIIPVGKYHKGNSTVGCTDTGIKIGGGNNI